MRELSSDFIVEKNRIDGRTTWAHLVELSLNVNSTVYMTTNPDTLAWNNRFYMPVPMKISAEEQDTDGSLPKIQIQVANPVGTVYKFARDNNLVLRDVTIRMINTSLTNSGDDTRVTMQILGMSFLDEAAVFTLGFNFNFDAEGPLRVYNRRDHPMLPINVRNYAILS